jgi:hypothetical protein
MSNGITRTISRWIHIVFAIPILGYIYDSPSNTHYYAFSIRYFFVPVLALSGLWLWKGHVVRRLFSKTAEAVIPPFRKNRERMGHSTNIPTQAKSAA